MNLFLEPEFIQAFSTFLSRLAVVTLDFKSKIIVGIVTIYPETEQNIRICLDSYTDLEFPWRQNSSEFLK